MNLVQRFKALDDQTRLALYLPVMFTFWWLMAMGMGSSCDMLK